MTHDQILQLQTWLVAAEVYAKDYKKRERPEDRIRDALRTYLEDRGWLVEITHGNIFQNGLPDLYCYHPKWGERWIDVKVAGKYSFTKAQKVKWPRWEKFGVPIYILTAATFEEYKKLMGPPNWRQYWKKSWGKLPDIKKLIEDLKREANKAE